MTDLSLDDWSVYGRGSGFSSYETPRDVDVVAIGPTCPEDPANRSKLTKHVRGLVGRGHLDLAVRSFDAIDTEIAAIIRHHGKHLAGPDLSDQVPEVNAAEWAVYCATVATFAEMRPAKRALRSIMALEADAGRLSFTKDDAATAAQGTRWEAVAAAALADEHSIPAPGHTFEHPDLDDLIDAARQIHDADHWTNWHPVSVRSGWWPTASEFNTATACLYGASVGPEHLANLYPDVDGIDDMGDASRCAAEWAQYAGHPPIERPGLTWIPRAIAPSGVPIVHQPPPTAPWTVYEPGTHRYALTAEDCQRAREEIEDLEWREVNLYGPGAIQATTPTWLKDKLSIAVLVANWAWWRYDVESFESNTKRYKPGDHHPPHSDAVAIPTARKLSAVAMLSEPDDYSGGDLIFDVGHTRATIPKTAGTVVIAPSHILHQVRRLTAGERLTTIVHAFGPPLR